MLDFIVVLGRVPGTNFVITFNELLIVFFIFSGRYEYNLHRRWIHWAWYRLCVNYRKYKRQLKTFIKTKRYRLAVWERRQIRTIQTYIRRRKRAIIWAIIRTERRIFRRAIRTRKAVVLAIYSFLRRLKRRINLKTRRTQRAIYTFFYRRYSWMKRRYYSQVIKLQRLERRFKRRLSLLRPA